MNWFKPLSHVSSANAGPASGKPGITPAQREKSWV